MRPTKRGSCRVLRAGLEYHRCGGDIVESRLNAAERGAVNISHVDHSWRGPARGMVTTLFEMSDAHVQMRACTVGEIKIAVAHFFGMSVEKLEHRNTTQAVIVPRQIAMYLARQIANASLAEIGREFGGMHYTTVAHSIGRVEKQRKKKDGVELVIRILLEGIKC
jgi:hypothetical protein